MVGGVSAEAERVAILTLDGATGQVTGKAQIRDLTRSNMPACGLRAPPPPPEK